MKKITVTTKNAIIKRINGGHTSFHIGDYYYEADVFGDTIHRIRRREQVVGRTPTSDWEVVCCDNEWC